MVRHSLFYDDLSGCCLACSFSTKLMYWERERSSCSANQRNFSTRSLSMVMLIFSFNGFTYITLLNYTPYYDFVLTSRGMQDKKIKKPRHISRRKSVTIVYCSKCGKEIMNEAIICPHCGCGTVNYFAMMNRGASVNPVPTQPTVPSVAPTPLRQQGPGGFHPAVYRFVSDCRTNLVLSYLSLGACLLQFFLGIVLILSESVELSVFLAHFSLATLIFMFVVMSQSKGLRQQKKPAGLTPVQTELWKQAKATCDAAGRINTGVWITNFVFWLLFSIALILGWAAFFELLAGEDPTFDLGVFFKN